MIFEKRQRGRSGSGRTAGMWEFTMRTQTFAGSLEKQTGSRLVWFNRFRRNIETARTWCRQTDVSSTMCAQGNLFESFWGVQTSFIYLSFLPFKTKLNGFFFCLLSTFFGFCFLIPRPKSNGVHIGVERPKDWLHPPVVFSEHSQKQRRQFDAMLQRSEIYLPPPLLFLDMCKDERRTLASSCKSKWYCIAGWSCVYSTSSFQPLPFLRKTKFNTTIRG